VRRGLGIRGLGVAYKRDSASYVTAVGVKERNGRQRA